METPSRSIPLNKKKYLLRDSARSGFTYRNVELFLDNGQLVGGDEYDAPPPSNRLYPGEGDVSPGDIRINYTDLSNQPATISPVQTVNTASMINLNQNVDNAQQYDYNKSVVYVNGSATGVSLNSNPQIAPSFQGDFLTIQGAGTSFTLSTGRGLRLYTNTIRIDSGTMLNLIYNSTSGVWNETSRMGPNFSLQGVF